MRSRLLGLVLTEAAACCSSSASSCGASRGFAAAASAEAAAAASAEAAAAAGARTSTTSTLSRRLARLQQSPSPLSSLLFPCSRGAPSCSSSSPSSRTFASSAPKSKKAPQQQQSPSTLASTSPTQSSPPAQIPQQNSRYTPPIAAGPGGTLGTSLRASPVASGVLAEPFRGDPPPLPLSSWITPSGWKVRWRRWISGAKSMYTLAKCKKLIPGWTLLSFKRDALELYERTCRAIAAGDRGSLRSTMTPLEYSAAKNQIRSRQEAGWDSIEWSLAEPRPAPSKDVEVVHARLVMANPKDERAGFAQVTVRVRCRHRFVARDSRGRIVATAKGGGSGSGGRREKKKNDGGELLSPSSSSEDDDVNSIDVVDTWVLERFLGGGPSARWRLAGRLSADVSGSGERRRSGGLLSWLAARKSAENK